MADKNYAPVPSLPKGTVKTVTEGNKFADKKDVASASVQTPKGKSK